MSNTLTTGLKRDTIAEAVLTALLSQLTPLGLFSTAFRDIPLQGTDKMQVPYYPAVTAASKDFSGSYEFDNGSSTQSKEIAIDQRKYQPASYTSAERARQPNLDPQKLGMMKGHKLAEDIIADILSLVVAGTYGNTALSGDNYDAATKLVSTYANFDMDDVVDLETIADSRKWPVVGRGLILKPSYLGNVKKDLVSDGGLATYGFNPAGRPETFPMLNSFNVAQSTLIPGNSENLTGIAVYPSALLVGFSPIEPSDRAKAVIDYQRYTSPETGLTLEYRAWFDPDEDTEKEVFEVNYGRAAGETGALTRIVSS